MITNREKHLKPGASNILERFFNRPGRYGLQARLTASYIWVTVIAEFLLVGLYAAFLAANIQFTLSQANDALTSQITSYPWQAAIVMTLLILLTAPLLGGRFGTLATRSLVQRIQNLVLATAQIEQGNYTQCVSVSPVDEIGRLEQQFNSMAQQLAESIALRQKLAEQNARLAERARITRELHDAISQELFSLRMLTDGLQMALPTDSPLQSKMATVEGTTANIIREMRALLLELRPLQLEQLGLAAALAELAAMYRTRLNTTVSASIPSLPPLDAEVEHTLLRIAQEALSNAVRHADATRIELKLEPLGETIMLTIADNGKGFSMHEENRHYGLGLRLMQERVQALHGEIEIQAAPNQGTSIHVYLPGEKRDDSSCHR